MPQEPPLPQGVSQLQLLCLSGARVIPSMFLLEVHIWQTEQRPKWDVFLRHHQNSQTHTLYVRPQKKLLGMTASVSGQGRRVLSHRFIYFFASSETPYKALAEIQFMSKLKLLFQHKCTPLCAKKLK